MINARIGRNADLLFIDDYLQYRMVMNADVAMIAETKVCYLLSIISNGGGANSSHNTAPTKITVNATPPIIAARVASIVSRVIPPY